MKKIFIALIAVTAIILSGCQKASDLLSEPSPTPIVPVVTYAPISTEEPQEPATKIAISRTLKMTNDWTIIGDYDVSLTGGATKDRVVLGTSAKEKNGEIMWDDAQYWTIAVLNEDGAYNLFSQHMSGQVYIEISEAYINGFSTPVITAYIFSGTDREVRNYVFADGVFEETVVYSTKEFSTGGVNCLYSTLPENEAK